MTGKGAGGTATGVSGGEEDGTDFSSDFGKEGMVGDTDTDTDFLTEASKFVEVEMMEGGVFR